MDTSAIIPSNLPVVSVIVPTTCEKTRSEFIERAIASILDQAGAELDVIIVVNGDRLDTALLNQLESTAQLRVIRIAEGNVSVARYAGVANARGSFFCFLDDDDEFLPGAIKQRLDIFDRFPDADIVVTNGYVFTDHDEPLVTQPLESQINGNPAKSFLNCNWFASPASLFRANRIEPAIFDMKYKYFEWTYLFFLLLSQRKSIRFDSCLTYRIYRDHSYSVSKSTEYYSSYPAFLLALNDLPLDTPIRKIISGKYAASLNSLSNMQMSQGCLRQAWIAHIKCLIHGGWRYLPYTRHLLLASLK
ncbi:MAG: glycosyltransferase family 2 protein [Pseudomonadota bacterium]